MNKYSPGKVTTKQTNNIQALEHHTHKDSPNIHVLSLATSISDNDIYFKRFIFILSSHLCRRITKGMII